MLQSLETRNNRLINGAEQDLDVTEDEPLEESCSHLLQGRHSIIVTPPASTSKEGPLLPHSSSKSAVLSKVGETNPGHGWVGHDKTSKTGDTKIKPTQSHVHNKVAPPKRQTTTYVNR
jgi:hypothetical protein